MATHPIPGEMPVEPDKGPQPAPPPPLDPATPPIPPR